MSLRIVFIGGFNNGKSTVNRTGEVISQHYNDTDVDSFTFSYAMGNVDKIRRASKGVLAITHSAGMLALKDTPPSEVLSFNAPVPVSIKHLLSRTLTKTVALHLPSDTTPPLASVVKYDLSTAAEFVRHSVANLRHIGSVASFNAFAMARELRSSDCDARLVYSSADRYFSPTEQVPRYQDVPTYMIDGMHDQLAIAPEETLRFAEAAINDAELKRT